MRKRIMTFIMRLFIKETIIFSSSDYPNYNNLSNFGFLILNTFHGNFMFNVKEDIRNNVGYSRKFLFSKPRLFTVELRPLEGVDTRSRTNYVDKVVLVVKIGRFCFSKTVLINILVNVYLETVWKDLTTERLM